MDEKLVVEMVKAYCRRTEAYQKVHLYGMEPDVPYYKFAHEALIVSADETRVEFVQALEAVVEDVYPGFILEEVRSGR